MPRIVSTAIASSNDQEDHGLLVYYCLCGEYALIIDEDLSKLPHRKTDHAHIITHKLRKFKLNLISEGPKLLKRGEGYEKQRRMLCTRCGLWIAYKTDPKHPDADSDYTYVVENSLTLVQDVIPRTNS